MSSLRKALRATRDHHNRGRRPRAHADASDCSATSVLRTSVSPSSQQRDSRGVKVCPRLRTTPLVPAAWCGSPLCIAVSSDPGFADDAGRADFFFEGGSMRLVPITCVLVGAILGADGALVMAASTTNVA